MSKSSAKNGFSRSLVILIIIALAAGWVIIPTSTSMANSPPTRPHAVSPDLDQSASDSSEGEGVATQSESLTSLASEDSCTAVFQSGGDRLATLQNDDGGWDWPLDNGDPTTSSPANTIGPIAMGLAQAYYHTEAPDHWGALEDAGDFLLAKTKNFSPSDGYLAAELDRIFGDSTYRDHVVAYYYDPLAGGTYDRNGAGTLYDTAEYVNLIRTARASQGIPNLAAWDIGMGLVGAASVGADTVAWIDGVKAEIDELDGNAYYDVIGLTGALYGLAFVGEDFDPTAGEHAAASDLGDLASILASYQIDGGGFTWNKDYMDPDQNNETIQETAYAVLALDEFDRTTHLDAIQGAVDYMKGVQLPNGGWKNWAGDGENNEVTGEALWGISVGLPGPATSNVLVDPNPVAASSPVLVSAMVEGCAVIASAEYSLDGGPWMAMAALDGTFDALSENVEAGFNSPTEAGIYDLCVRGTNAPGTSGPGECIMLVVYDPDGGFVTGGGWIDSPEGAVPPVLYSVWEQGFETDIDGWFTPNRVPSGSNGVPSASGDYHAEATTDYTLWGGFSSVFPDSGFITSLDVYLDMEAGYTNDTRFDWTSAISAPDGDHRRDFIFNGGYYNDDTDPGANLSRFVFSASNNAPGWPKNPERDPFAVMETGWYTLQHRFYDSGAGVLAVDMSILDSSDSVLHTWTLSDPSDIIGATVGGNRYGWFAYNGFSHLAIDNSRRIEVESPTGKATFGFVSKYKKGAEVPTGNTEFQFKAGNLSFHSTSYDWLVVTGSDFAKFKGAGLINGALADNGEPFKFQLWAGDGEPDTFHIKIWWEDGSGEHVVYDNGMNQPISSGNIVVHSK